MKTYSFNVVIEPDEDAERNPAWHAYCPALVNIGATSGRSREESAEKYQCCCSHDCSRARVISPEEPRIAVTV
jgi:hypothetical protein